MIEQIANAHLTSLSMITTIVLGQLLIKGMYVPEQNFVLELARILFSPQIISKQAQLCSCSIEISDIFVGTSCSMRMPKKSLLRNGPSYCSSS